MKKKKKQYNNSIIINNDEIEYKCDNNINDTSQQQTTTTMVAIAPSSLSSSPSPSTTSPSFSSNHLRHRIGNNNNNTSHDKYTTTANTSNNDQAEPPERQQQQQQQHIPQEQHPRYYDNNINQSHHHNSLPQSDCSMMAYNSSVDVTRNDAAEASQKYHINNVLEREGEEEKEIELKLKKGRFNNNNNYHEIIGTLRIQMELRQLGGLMFVLGIGSAFSTMALISHLIVGESGSMQVEGFLLPILVGNILQLCCGLTAMGCGFIALLLGPYPSRTFHKACKITTLIINLGPIAFVITVMRIIQGAKDPPEVNNFIPMALNPNQTDIKFCSAMGVLVLVSVCCSLIGGLTVLGLHMCAILGQQPHSRHRSYHYIRLIYYNLLVMIGGLSQLLLGAYLWVRFGSGPYEQPVHVAAYTIHFPIVSVVVGIVQTMMGLLGIYWHKPRYSKYDHSFIYIVGLTWLITTALQFILQPAYSNDDMYNAEGATVASVYLGFFVMPIFLDYSVRNTPIQPRPEYYGLPSDAYYKEDFLAKLLKMEPKNYNCKTTTIISSSLDDPLNCKSNDPVTKTTIDGEVTPASASKPSAVSTISVSSEKTNNNNNVIIVKNPSTGADDSKQQKRRETAADLTMSITSLGMETPSSSESPMMIDCETEFVMINEQNLQATTKREGRLIMSGLVNFKSSRNERDKKKNEVIKN